MSNTPFAAWHDFYSLIGTAAATLVGLMFVAASVGTGVFTKDRQVGLRTFLSPTVVAFSVVLATSLIAMLPVLDWRGPGALLAGQGALGILYSWRVWRRMVGAGIGASIDWEDRAWYTIVPALSYFILLSGGLALGLKWGLAADILAGGVCLLLLAGLRNAWDMTTWVVLSRNG